MPQLRCCPCFEPITAPSSVPRINQMDAEKHAYLGFMFSKIMTNTTQLLIFHIFARWLISRNHLSKA